MYRRPTENLENSSKKNYTLLNDLSPEEVVTNRFSLSIFNTNTGTVLNHTLNKEFYDTPGTFAEKFRSLSKNKQAKLKDVAFGLRAQCMLFTDSLYCYRKNNDYTLNFPDDFKPTKLSSLSGIPNQDMFFIVTEEGEHYRIPFEADLDEISFEDLQHTPSLASFRSAALMPKLKRYAVDKDGVFVNYENTSNLHPVIELEHIRFNKIFGPYMWSEKLLEL